MTKRDVFLRDSVVSRKNDPAFFAIPHKILIC